MLRRVTGNSKEERVPKAAYFKEKYYSKSISRGLVPVGCFLEQHVVTTHISSSFSNIKFPGINLHSWVEREAVQVEHLARA